MDSGYLTLSPSKIGRLRRCARLAYYEDTLGREPVTRPWGENDFGSVIHRGLEGFYLDLRAENAMTWAIHVGLAAIDAKGTDEKGVPYGSPSDPHERAAARAVIRGYAARYGAEDAATFEVVGVELPFELDALRGGSGRGWGRTVRGAKCGVCDGGDIMSEVLNANGDYSAGKCPSCAGRGHLGPRVNGRIDLVVKARPLECLSCKGGGCSDCNGKGSDHPGGSVVVIDHKTTGSKLGNGHESNPSAHLVSGAELRLQAGMYVDAVRALGLGEPTLFVYDYIRRPDFSGHPSGPPKRAIKPDANVDSPRWGETPYEYEERLVALMAARPAEWFYRHAIEVTAELISETRANIADTAAEIKWRRGRGAWPMNDASCTSFNRPCAWLPVCVGGANPEDDTLYRLKRKEEVDRG